MAVATETRGAFRMNEAARYVGLSRDTLERLWQRGELATFTIGRARFISARELDRFIAEREEDAR